MQTRRELLKRSARAASGFALASGISAPAATAAGEAKRIQFAICNETFQKWEYRDIVDCVAKTGYDAIELAPFTFADSVCDLTPAKRREIRSMTEDAGLKIAGLHWLLAKPDGLHINHPDAAIRQKTRDYLAHLIDFSADLGGKILVFGSPKQRKILPEISREDAWKHTVDTLGALGPKAKERGVMICLEALEAALTNLLNTNAEIRKMVSDVNHTAIQMMLDVRSMCTEPIPVPQNIRECKGLFHHFHANDPNMLGPGFGKVDFKPIFATLKELGYHGYVSVEIFDYSVDPRTMATKSLEYMKSCLG